MEPISKACLASQVSSYIHLLSPVTITPGWPSLHRALQWAGSSQSPSSSSRPKFSVTSYIALILKVFHGYFLPPQSWNRLVVQSLQSLATPTSSAPLPESSDSSPSGLPLHRQHTLYIHASSSLHACPSPECPRLSVQTRHVSQRELRPQLPHEAFSNHTLFH